MGDLADRAAEPLGVTTDEGSIRERPIAEQIAAEKHEAEATAAAAVPWGMRAAKLKFGGTT